MSDLRFRMLGPLEVERDGSPIALVGRQQRTVLGLFLVHASEPLSADRLVEELWGEPTPPRAVRRLQVAVTRLRRALGAGAELALESGAGGYRLTLGPSDLDADVFRRRVGVGRRTLGEGDAAGAAAVLRGALGLWRGPPLADVAYEPF